MISLNNFYTLENKNKKTIKFLEDKFKINKIKNMKN